MLFIIKTYRAYFLKGDYYSHVRYLNIIVINIYVNLMPLPTRILKPKNSEKQKKPPDDYQRI